MRRPDASHCKKNCYSWGYVFVLGLSAAIQELLKGITARRKEMSPLQLCKTVDETAVMNS